MNSIALEFPLPALNFLFSVPSNDPLQSDGPLLPVFEQVLREFRTRRIPKQLQLTLVLPADVYQPEMLAEVQSAWQRAIDNQIEIETARLGDLRFSRRRHLLKGVTILASALALGQLVANYETGFFRTLAESLIIGGWVAVWVPLERVFYTGWPIGREIDILNCLKDCDLQLKPSV